MKDVAEARAEFLVGIVARHAGKEDRILEVGSREGDNIATLLDAGFRELSGVEDNLAKAAGFAARHPHAASAARVTAGPVEEYLRGLPDGSLRLVFTVGFLFDRKGDYGWLPGELARLTSRSLIFIENEDGGPYKDAFENLGLEQVEETDLASLPELESVFVARVFEKVRPS